MLRECPNFFDEKSKKSAECREGLDGAFLTNSQKHQETNK